MVTNVEVREALINCFVEAHKEFMKKGSIGSQAWMRKLKRTQSCW